MTFGTRTRRDVRGATVGYFFIRSFPSPPASLGYFDDGFGILPGAPTVVSNDPGGMNIAAGTAAASATACTGIDTAADAEYIELAATAPNLATALAHPCPVARNSVGYATALRIHDMAPMGAAGTRPTSIMSTSPHRRDESVRDSGTKSSGMDTAAHALATHRGFTFDRNATSAETFPTTSPLFTMRMAT